MFDRPEREGVAPDWQPSPELRQELETGPRPLAHSYYDERPRLVPSDRPVRRSNHWLFLTFTIGITIFGLLMAILVIAGSLTPTVPGPTPTLVPHPSSLILPLEFI